MDTSDSAGKFVFEVQTESPRPSALYEQHLELTSKSRLADFAGYLMPLWYSSIAQEHNAVRNAAGLFDCTHMGILEVKGPDAAVFLDLVTTNDLGKLSVRKAQYAYVLDATGNILDDIIIYRLESEKFMVVVNAANEPKIKAYFRALLKDEAVIASDAPGMKLEYKPAIRDMRETSSDQESRVDIALQGPNSTQILKKLIEDATEAESVENLKSFELTYCSLGGIDCIVSKTGYTGAKTAYEIFVSPEDASRLWKTLLEKGASLGLLPCGLGARDSLRIEAGLPLYGHELDGEFNISPFTAGYGWAVKLEKEFFIGKDAACKQADSQDMKVVRIEFPGQKGIRPIRYRDAVLDDENNCIGWILSAAKAGESQIALAYVKSDRLAKDDAVAAAYAARNQRQIDQGKKEKFELNDNIVADIKGTVVSRFEKF